MNKNLNSNFRSLRILVSVFALCYHIFVISVPGPCVITPQCPDSTNAKCQYGFEIKCEGSVAGCYNTDGTIRASDPLCACGPCKDGDGADIPTLGPMCQGGYPIIFGGAFCKLTNGVVNRNNPLCFFSDHTLNACPNTVSCPICPATGQKRECNSGSLYCTGDPGNPTHHCTQSGTALACPSTVQDCPAPKCPGSNIDATCQFGSTVKCNSAGAPGCYDATDRYTTAPLCQCPPCTDPTNNNAVISAGPTCLYTFGGAQEPAFCELNPATGAINASNPLCRVPNPVGSLACPLTTSCPYCPGSTTVKRQCPNNGTLYCIGTADNPIYKCSNGEDPLPCACSSNICPPGANFGATISYIAPCSSGSLKCITIGGSEVPGCYSGSTRVADPYCKCPPCSTDPTKSPGCFSSTAGTVVAACKVNATGDFYGDPFCGTNPLVPCPLATTPPTPGPCLSPQTCVQAGPPVWLIPRCSSGSTLLCARGTAGTEIPGCYANNERIGDPLCACPPCSGSSTIYPQCRDVRFTESVGPAACRVNNLGIFNANAPTCEGNTLLPCPVSQIRQCDPTPTCPNGSNKTCASVGTTIPIVLCDGVTGQPGCYVDNTRVGDPICSCPTSIPECKVSAVDPSDTNPSITVRYNCPPSWGTATTPVIPVCDTSRGEYMCQHPTDPSLKELAKCPVTRCGNVSCPATNQPLAITCSSCYIGPSAMDPDDSSPLQCVAPDILLCDARTGNSYCYKTEGPGAGSIAEQIPTCPFSDCTPTCPATCNTACPDTTEQMKCENSQHALRCWKNIPGCFLGNTRQSDKPTCPAPAAPPPPQCPPLPTCNFTNPLTFSPAFIPPVNFDCPSGKTLKCEGTGASAAWVCRDPLNPQEANPEAPSCPIKLCEVPANPTPQTPGGCPIDSDRHPVGSQCLFCFSGDYVGTLNCDPAVEVFACDARTNDSHCYSIAGAATKRPPTCSLTPCQPPTSCAVTTPAGNISVASGQKCFSADNSQAASPYCDVNDGTYKCVPDFHFDCPIKICAVSQNMSVGDPGVCPADSTTITSCLACSLAGVVKPLECASGKLFACENQQEIKSHCYTANDGTVAGDPICPLVPCPTCIDGSLPACTDPNGLLFCLRSNPTTYQCTLGEPKPCPVPCPACTLSDGTVLPGVYPTCGAEEKIALCGTDGIPFCPPTWGELHTCDIVDCAPCDDGVSKPLCDQGILYCAGSADNYLCTGGGTVKEHCPVMCTDESGNNTGFGIRDDHVLVVYVNDLPPSQGPGAPSAIISVNEIVNPDCTKQRVTFDLLARATKNRKPWKASVAAYRSHFKKIVDPTTKRGVNLSESARLTKEIHLSKLYPQDIAVGAGKLIIKGISAIKQKKSTRKKIKIKNEASKDYTVRCDTTTGGECEVIQQGNLEQFVVEFVCKIDDELADCRKVIDVNLCPSEASPPEPVSNCP